MASLLMGTMSRKKKKDLALNKAYQIITMLFLAMLFESETFVQS